VWTLEDRPAAVASRVDDGEPDVVDVAGQVLGELDAVIAPWFARAGTRLAAQQYVRGLASTVERKNSWQLAEHAGHASPDRLQRLLGSAAWDEHGVREDVRNWAVRYLACDEAVLVADDTGFLKKGRNSAGVQRQYSGTAGRVENCQIGVFVAYASPHGRVLIDAELYLPASWTDDRQRCAAAGIPVEVGFATKPELARVMIERAVTAEVPFGWVAADEAYGDNPGLRAWLESESIRYVMAVSCDHPVATDGGPVRADTLAARAELVWRRLSCGDGAKGPRLYDFAETSDTARPSHRLVIRRAIDDGELAFFWCHTPTGASLADLVRVIGMRWAVEECFQACKGQVGLDHYQVRSHPGWYRHITLAIAAHAWLTVTAVLLAGKKGRRHPTVQPPRQPIR
jgi:SRSO17 transposase